ncbi:hypothetical protein F5884DRAFT_790136 [Xylogone sp. PMI_703]|nr:hypothetical protein F5884DRAFT_790136 [Xylogone sp. PMI_703]
MVLPLYEASIDEKRPLRVITVGAGISGILAGIRIPQRLPGVDLVIYEKNPDIGGTWYDNRYPGVACDLPAHSYQLTFEPNPRWSQFYASGQEIHRYWKGVVKKYGADRYIKVNHKVLEARFNEETAKWHVKIQKTDTGEVFEDTSDLLHVCLGVLNRWKWPDIKGLHDFTGEIIHSAAWPKDWNATDKEVAVIGAGSSAIQIIPGIQPKVKRLDNYVRGRTWISPPFAPSEVEKHTSTDCNFAFSEEELQQFVDNPDYYFRYRKAIEQEVQSFHSITFKGERSRKAAKEFEDNMRKKLAKRPDIFNALVPDFPPACRRLTPGPGYLDALVKPNVDFITTEIESITEGGIKTIDGTLRNVDTIICATGFDTTWQGAFPIIGRGGKLLTERWSEHQETYMTLAVDGFPNMFLSFGPNGGLGAGSLSACLEKVTDHVVKIIDKFERDMIRIMEVKPQAVRAFEDYMKAYFPKTVFTANCRSWYKGSTVEGEVRALWPGSSLHYMQALKHPRWEDYNYEYINNNPYAWLGDGWTECEKHEGMDRCEYLNPENIDFPPPVGTESTVTHKQSKVVVTNGLKTVVSAVHKEAITV